MDRNLSEAISHINSEPPYEYDHKCNGCVEGFDRGHGVQITDEKFCNPCIDEQKHYEFYRECGLSDGEIYHLVTNYMQAL